MGNHLIGRLQVANIHCYIDCIITTYYVNRNLLKVGVHEVNMWPTSRFNEKDIGNAERFSCDPNPIGPVANNSDSDAVKLTIEFEHFVHPVVFPNDVPTHVAKTRCISNC